MLSAICRMKFFVLKTLKSCDLIQCWISRNQYLCKTYFAQLSEIDAVPLFPGRRMQAGRFGNMSENGEQEQQEQGERGGGGEEKGEEKAEENEK